MSEHNEGIQYPLASQLAEGKSWPFPIFEEARSLSSPHATKKKAPFSAGPFSWYKIVDAFQTAATLTQEDYKLNLYRCNIVIIV
ncbi:hypothetical protein BH23PAT1_BH23PAT1_1770 [soil metagenome]